MNAKEARKKANSMKYSIAIGKNKLNGKQTELISKKLKKDSLIKIKLMKSIKEEKKALAEEIAEKTGSKIMEIKGSTVVLFRQKNQKE